MTDHGRPRVLFIDAYDSFTNNIVALLETRLTVHVTVIKIDAKIEDLPHFLGQFAAVVLGPGPGDPRKDKDVGLFRRFWQLKGEEVIPILGICLGFQSLVLAFGGNIERLSEPRHGLVRKIQHYGTDIFQGLVSPIDSIQYHSLHAALRLSQASDPEFSDAPNLESRQTRADLLPLAWDVEADNISMNTCTSYQNPDAILMAVRHRFRPFHGIQFHSESVCSSSNAQEVIVNWWIGVRKWWATQPERVSQVICNQTPPHGLHNNHLDLCNPTSKTTQEACMTTVLTKIVHSSNLKIPAICSRLGLSAHEIVVLDSEKHQRANVGEHSIIGIVSPASLRFEHNVGDSFVRQIFNGRTMKIDLRRRFCGNVFNFLKDFVQQNEAQSEYKEIPFWGGLIGYVDYDSCLETINVSAPPIGRRNQRHLRKADLSFVFIQRSIVIAHLHQKIYIQSLVPGDHLWVDDTCSLLARTLPPSPPSSPFLCLNANITLPNEADYKNDIRSAQEFIRAGDSYELCLTTCATIRTPNRLPSWPLYLRLRQINPAPFGAYVRLGGLTLLSSSPERFLSWTRPSRTIKRAEGKTSICQFRPIKGTVSRQASSTCPALTLEQAERLLATPKEIAENLMIVDLIRHDLHGVVGSGNVSVPKLMVVEEYETLFQLVSVIEGVLRTGDMPGKGDNRNNLQGVHYHNFDAENPLVHRPARNFAETRSGIDVLAASLPPGSMTGAPKLRACQILQSLEGRSRGVYSGVVGYLDVGGGGDFSVVIRSAVRWDGSDYEGSAADSRSFDAPNQGFGEKTTENIDCNGRPKNSDSWTIGAGGAITALSTEDGEFQEMMAKLKSTLRLFEDETTTYEHEV